MTRIVLDVDSCWDCPAHEKKQGPSQTSCDVWCRRLGRKIQGYVESKREMPPVPDDCPLLPNNINIMKESIDDE